MPRRWFKLLTFIIAVCGVVFSAPLPATAARATTPALTIVAPVAAAEVRGTAVTVRFRLEHFMITSSSVPLAEYGQRPDLNRPNEGHIHMRLDLGPIVVVDSGTSFTFTDVPPGEHLLKVSLSNNDHSDLSPEVEQEIVFHTSLQPADANAPVVSAGAEQAPAHTAEHGPARMPVTAIPFQWLEALADEPLLLAVVALLAIGLVAGVGLQLAGRVVGAYDTVVVQLRSMRRTTRRPPPQG